MGIMAHDFSLVSAILQTPCQDGVQNGASHVHLQA